MTQINMINFDELIMQENMWSSNDKKTPCESYVNLLNYSYANSCTGMSLKESTNLFPALFTFRADFFLRAFFVHVNITDMMMNWCVEDCPST